MRALLPALTTALTIGLTIGLWASTTLAAGLGEMSDAERAAFRAEVRDYLVENPEVIVEAMGVLQSREDVAAGERDKALVVEYADAIFNDPASWVGGNPDGDITVVEFMDYRCSYCRKAKPELDELVKSDGNIRLIIKEFPILGEGSMLSSRYAVAVLQLYGNDAYKAAHDALMTLRGDATPETLTRMATDMGLDAAKIIDRMNAPEVKAVIDANHALGSSMDINGTPMFVIQNSMVRGYLPLEDMRKLVEDARKE